MSQDLQYIVTKHPNNTPISLGRDYEIENTFTVRRNKIARTVSTVNEFTSRQMNINCCGADNVPINKTASVKSNTRPLDLICMLMERFR